jgi:hypothetical protein
MATNIQSWTSDKAHALEAVTGIVERKCDCGQHTIAGKECDRCSDNRNTHLQRAAIGPATADPIPLVQQTLNSAGNPLDHATRALMESRFAQDFSRVRVHTDTKAGESARALNALAYTVGPRVVFGSDQYAPNTNAGRRLLAHELAHVIQQKDISNSGTTLEISSPHDQSEREAEMIESQYESSGHALPPVYHMSPKISRKVDSDGGAQRSNMIGDPFSSTLPYREATELIKCIQIMGAGSDAYCRQQVLGEEPLAPVVFITREGGEAKTFVSTEQLSFTAKVLNSPGSSPPAKLFNWTVHSASANSGNGNPHTALNQSRFAFTPNPTARPTTGSRRPNEPIKYRVDAEAGGRVGSFYLEQDETDIIRQEYIDLGPVQPPQRSDIMAPTIPGYNTGNYGLIVDGGMDNALTKTETQFQALTPAPQAPTPALNVSSGFRNPRRNVAAGSNFPVGSHHVWGTALDLTVAGANATLWARLRQAGANARNTSICEHGPTQIPCNAANVDHVHIQW